MKQRILYCNVPEKELYDKYPWLEKANFSEAIITVTRKDGIDRLSWLDGVWYNGTWHDGVWCNGVWENGMWYYGMWYNGVWKSGEWHRGEWRNGEWFSGTWEKGIWENGTWLYGTWCNGVWRNGTWDQGLWKNGMWCNGVWENGVWLNGIESGHRARYRMSLTINGKIRIGCEVFTKKQLKKILVNPEDIIDRYFDGNEKAFKLQARYVKTLLNN